MDSLITAAARALAAGDPIGALSRVALREDAPALALRGIAMAQLGDLAKARLLVRRAARAFGVREPVARARCVASSSPRRVYAFSASSSAIRAARHSSRVPVMCVAIVRLLWVCLVVEVAAACSSVAVG